MSPQLPTLSASALSASLALTSSSSELMYGRESQRYGVPLPPPPPPPPPIAWPLLLLAGGCGPRREVVRKEEEEGWWWW